MEYETLLPLAVLLFVASTWFVVHHAKRRTSLFILLLSIVSFSLGSATVALLPIDLSYASRMNTLNDNHAGSASDSNADDGNDANDGGDSDNGGPSMSDNPTYVPWQITYWTTFLLAWLALPVARETLLSGHFTLRQRLDGGLRRYVRVMSAMACCGVVGAIGMAIHLQSVHFVTIVLPVLMALGNTYGLLLVSLLLGNGLVNIPKRLWRQACPANELRRTRVMAPIFEEELFEAVMGLEDVEDKIEEVCRTAVSLREGEDHDDLEDENGDVVVLGAGRATRCCWCYARCCRKGGGGGVSKYCKVDEVTEFHHCLEVLVRRKNETADACAGRRTRRGANDGPTRRRSSTGDGDENRTAGAEINTMDVKYLVSLGRQLKRAQERVTSAELRWNHLVEHSRQFSALMDDRVLNDEERGDGVSPVDGGSTDVNLLSHATAPPRCRRLRWCSRRIRLALQRTWVRFLRYPAYRASALVAATLSALVLLSEVTLAAPLDLSPFSWTLHALDAFRGKGSTSNVVFQACALVPLLYMSLCVYTCLFQMSLLGPYCLRGNRQSAGVALVFNAQYLVRLQFPLGYNYLLMLKYDMTHCAFSNIMSDMSTIPFFGTSFSVYAPLLILAVCLFTLCDFYPKMLRLLGIEHEDALLLGDEDELDGKANEGIQLMKREAERRSSAAMGGAVRSSPEKQSLNSRRSLIV